MRSLLKFPCLEARRPFLAAGSPVGISGRTGPGDRSAGLASHNNVANDADGLNAQSIRLITTDPATRDTKMNKTTEFGLCALGAALVLGIAADALLSPMVP